MIGDDLDVTELFEYPEPEVNGIPISVFRKLIFERYADAVPRGVYAAPLGELTGEADPRGIIFLNTKIDEFTVKDEFDLPEPVGPRAAAVLTFCHEVGHFKCGHIRLGTTLAERKDADMFLSSVTGKVKQLVERIRAQREREADVFAIQEFQNLRNDLVKEGIIEMSATEKTEILQKKQAEIKQEMAEIQAEAAKEAAEKAKREREASEAEEEKEIQEALSAETRLEGLRGKRDILQKEISEVELAQAQRQKQVAEGKRREALRKMEKQMKPLYQRLVQLNNVEIPTALNRCYEELERMAKAFDEMRAEETDLAAKLRGMEGELVKYGGTLASIHNAAVKAIAAEGGPVEISEGMHHLMDLIGKGGQATAWLWANTDSPVTRIFNPAYGKYHKSPRELLQIRTPIYRRQQQPANVPSVATLPGA